LEKSKKSIENEIKMNELYLNKSFDMKKSDNKVQDLEKDLELANINKRRNSIELETAVSIHQNSPLKSY
jgi:hypothetical protein